MVQRLQAGGMPSLDISGLEAAQVRVPLAYVCAATQRECCARKWLPSCWLRAGSWAQHRSFAVFHWSLRSRSCDSHSQCQLEDSLVQVMQALLLSLRARTGACS